MDAALAGAGIAMMDEAYAMPHLIAGRLRKLGATATLPEGYYLIAPVASGRRTNMLRPLQEWLINQAQQAHNSIVARNDL
jgi:LysR family glycine cleavage system transcriptional activator